MSFAKSEYTKEVTDVFWARSEYTEEVTDVLC